METSIEPSVIKPINSIYEYENNIKYQKMHFLFNALAVLTIVDFSSGFT